MRTLYRKGDREEVWGIKFDYAEFDDSQVDAALADGWVKNPLELKQQDDLGQPTDTNGDGNITWDDAIRLDKSATPKIIFGLTLNGAWKGWDLNVFFQGQADAEQLVQPTMNMATDFYEGRWIETNTAEQNAAAKWPRAFIKQTYGDAWNGVASTWWLRDASFVRLKSIELGYTLPKMWTKSIGIENARIYVNGNNLFTIDGMKICDPEAGMFKNTDGYVVESGGVRGYPLQRMITVGANVTF